MSRFVRPFVLALVVVLASCSPELDPATPSTDAGRDAVSVTDDMGGGPIVLDLVRPDRASTAGGTAFEIFGRGFVTGARVTFLLSGEELDATDVIVADSTRMTGRTPATTGRTGRASVRVSLPTGRTGTLPDVFSFFEETDGGLDPDMGPLPLDMGPPPPIDMGPPPDDMGPPHDDMGPPPPIDMGPPPPVDMGPPPPVDMGPADTGPRDMGPMDMGPPDTGPPDTGPRDMGPTDMGPADTGPADMGPVDAGPRVTVCLVERPPGTDPLSGSFVHGYLSPLQVAPRATRIQLTIPGLSGAPGASPGVVVEIGRGPIPGPGIDDISSWAWSTASYITDAGTIETYQAALLAPIDPGEYGIAARVTVPGSGTVYCDLDGIGNGFSASMTGVLTVRPTGTSDPDFCHVQSPESTSPPLTGRVLGTLSDYVYGWINEPGVTNAAGAGVGIAGEVGYGAVGSYPSTARWTWTMASYNLDRSSGNDDEYWDNPARIIAPGAGSYHIAYRFRLPPGAWLYCDSRGAITGGSADGYHPDTAIRMTISP